VGGQHLRTTYNRLSTGAAPVRRIMMIEEIIKTCKSILATKTNSGDMRCFFEDETNKILYVFGPSHYVRQGLNLNDNSILELVEFEGGPYIGIGDEVLANKYAIGIGITYDHNIPVVMINYDTQPRVKKKNNKKKKKK